MNTLNAGQLLRLPPPGGQDQRGQRARVPVADRRGQLQELQARRGGAELEGMVARWR